MVEATGIDHIYISVSDLTASEAFYNTVLRDVLGFRQNRFELASDPHVQYYNRHFGYVLRPTKVKQPHDNYAPGLHHLCFRVQTIADVQTAARALTERGISCTAPALYPDYAPDYWATFMYDPDGIRLEITNYRQERQWRHDHWDDLPA